MFRSDSKAFLSVTDLASVIFLSFHSAFAQPCKTVYNRSLDFFNEKVVHLLSSLYITYFSYKKQNKEIISFIITGKNTLKDISTLKLIILS